ncbi:RNA polymerase sigma-70 factor [Niabella hirudinis]|uniref:RNA polymerase sigma-70 factor n=1 Tax=Niabella hirudinis TaxID=1285929 RepID=UPI003EC13169
MQETSTQLLFRQIGEGQQDAFNRLFYRYYERLVGFAMQYVKQLEAAEDVVATLFVNIWQKRSQLPEIRSPQVYLFVATRNGCLNHLRRFAKPALPAHHYPHLLNENPVNTLHTEYKELEAILHAAIERLPEQRKMVFKLIREEGLKAREVAAILSISVRTVENQLYKALKTLAIAAGEYLEYQPQQPRAKRKNFLLFL